MNSKNNKITIHPFIVSILPFIATAVFYILSLKSDFILYKILCIVFFVLSFACQIAILCLETHYSLKSRKAMKEADFRLNFLSNISHEIRTPLNGIIGLNHITIQNLDNKELVHDNLLKTDKTARYLSTLINDVMTYSRFKNGSMVFDINDVLIGSLIDNVCSMEWGTFLDKGINLNLKTDLSIQCIMTDEVKIKQVLMNLLNNACKYTPKGGSVTVSAIQMSTSNDSVTTIISVTDTGIGISEDKQKEIFKTFGRKLEADSLDYGSFGLSLNVSKKILTALGGDLYVKSEEGQGSSFTIYLPSQISKLAPDEVVAREFKNVDLTHKKELNILAAEDNSLNAEILTEILGAAGYKVTLAKDGVEALQYFMDSKVGEYDLILMDIRMPNMNGYDACRNIRDLDRSDAKKIPIYACSANTFSEDRDMAIKSGMNDFIAKPIDVNKLLNKLKELE